MIIGCQNSLANTKEKQIIPPINNIDKNISSTKVEIGIASYYANRFHNRPTASGELYNKNSLTGAHKTLPFGTKVKVTRVSNNKSVIVRINDRGPYSKKRVIDLSYKGAKEIGLIRDGITKVKIEVL